MQARQGAAIKKMIGSKLAHYSITAHLGSGGVGDVYQATDTKLGRSVAIKLLPEAFARDAEREARVLASLDYVSYCTSVNEVC
jgi:serine/threonine protein kinase